MSSTQFLLPGGTEPRRTAMRRKFSRKTSHWRQLKRSKKISFHCLALTALIIYGFFFYYSVRFSHFVGQYSPHAVDIQTEVEAKAKTKTGPKTEIQTEVEAQIQTYLSIVIITGVNIDSLTHLFVSIVQQVTKFKFEVIVADVHCNKKSFDGINYAIADLDHFEKSNSTFPESWEVLALCDTPGYVEGKNQALKKAQENSKWVLFLDDGIVLEENFLQFLVDLGEKKRDAGNVGAVGCKMVNSDRSKVVEAGGIIWRDGSLLPVGIDRPDIDGSDIMCTRPVDYVSGQCLMVSKEVLSIDGAFETNAPFEDSVDFQMRISHTYKKIIWFQPYAVAKQMGQGSFSARHNMVIGQEGRKEFKEKWKEQLKKHDSFRRGTGYKMRSSRGPMRRTTSILYIDQMVPEKEHGQGFGRALDNVKMLAELGYFVTIHSMMGSQNCDDACKHKLEQDSIEVYAGGLKRHLVKRPNLYDIVIVSRPNIMGETKEKLLEYCRPPNEERKCAIIYDAEALWFRRDQLFLEAVQKGLVSEESVKIRDQIYYNFIHGRQNEEDLISTADVITTVSESEKEYIATFVNARIPSHVIGHAMEQSEPTKSTFESRQGIFFLASFNGNMYYNGDAIFYFIKFVYPLVVKSATEPIPLLIAGRKMSQELKDLVYEVNTSNEKNMKILLYDSPPDVRPLFEESRLFIAPHLYGAGIQYKMSEALSFGIPTVVSKISGEKMGLNSEESCIGDSSETLAECVLRVYNDKDYWQSLRQGGLKYIERTHKHSTVARTWQEVITSAKSAIAP